MLYAAIESQERLRQDIVAAALLAVQGDDLGTIRDKAVFAGGVAFAILLGNVLAPSLDLWIKRFQAPKKPEAKA